MKLIVSAALFALASPALAADVELLTNGGFETGDFSGWTEYGFDTTDQDVTYENVGVTFPYSGGYHAYFYGNGAVNGITQTLDTVAETYYNFSFHVVYDQSYHDLFTPNSLSVFWNGDPIVGTLVNLTPSSSYVGYQGVAYAISSSTSLSFAFTSDTYGDFLLDGVSVSAVAGVVPEPASWALMIAGFGMVGGALRRRRGTVLAV